MMNRRDFIRTTALGLGAVAAGTRWPLRLRANPLGLPIGLQLYTLRDQLDKDVPGTLKQVAEIGYKEVEIYDLYGKTAADFRALLNSDGLTAPSGHYMTKHIKSNWQKHIDDAKTMGLEYMVNAILEPEERKSFDDYKRLVDLFNHAGEETQKAGIQFCYHNHNFEFKKYGATTAYDYLLHHLDAKLVKMEMDCFWVTHAGHDPVAYFKKYPGRFPLLHIKDLSPGHPPTHTLDAKMGLFTEVGHGVIDWKRIFAAAPTGGLKHYFVEEDYCERPPIESARMSYEYLKNLKV
jgi:sugar phosphate isomerase/epimerase